MPQKSDQAKMEFTGESATLYSVFRVFLVVVAGLWWISYLLGSKHRKSSTPLPPGPVGLPILGNLHRLGALPHRSLHKLAQKYGPIMYMKLGLVPTIVVSSPEAAELFLKTNDLNFASRPIIISSDSMYYGSRGVGVTEYGPYWRNVRKLCTIHLLTVAKMESYMPLRKEVSREFVCSIRQAAKEGDVDISAQVGILSEKITYGMIFGKGYQEKYNLKPVIQEVLALLGAFNIADFIPAMRRFDVQGFNVRLKTVSKAVDDFLEKVITEHEEDTRVKHESDKDFIDILLSMMRSQTGEYNLERTHVKAIAHDMVGAALDTTATTVEWALSELLKHPRVNKKIQEEIGAVIGLDRLVEESDLANLPYLKMVVKETLRLHPPPLGPRQSIEDMTVGGYHIPGKSRVIINLWAINRDPKAWSPNPEEFYPERFTVDDRDIRGTDLRLIPFGAGRRKCPGIELGLRTVTFVLAQVVHCFDLDLPRGMSRSDFDMKEKFGSTVPRANPLLVVPTYRLRH